MKFKDYVKKLNELIEINPEIAEFDAITSKMEKGKTTTFMITIKPPVGKD